MGDMTEYYTAKCPICGVVNRWGGVDGVMEYCEHYRGFYSEIPYDIATTKTVLFQVLRQEVVEFGVHKVPLCSTCKVNPGVERVDNGLKAGVHCDECWEEMVRECRSRSW